jgi:hypothetical protein
VRSVTAVTLLTGPEPEARLRAFYERVRPGGFWGAIGASQRGGLAAGILLDWLFGLMLILGLTVGVGELLFGRPWVAGIWGGAALVGGVLLTLRLRAADPAPAKEHATAAEKRGG